MTIDFKSLNAALLGNLLHHLCQWLPNGRRVGNEYCVGSINGEPGQSLKINLQKGVWKDFSGDVGGSDPVSLYAAIHRLTMSEAAKRLTLGLPAAPVVVDARQEEPEFYPVLDPDEDMPDPKLGNYQAAYYYRNAIGNVLGIIVRRMDGGKKLITPRTPWYDAQGRIVWRWAGFAQPRPLYGLDLLASHPRTLVVVVEGEKCADALNALGLDLIAITWSGGAQAVDKTNWEPLSEREVVLWPDADDPGRNAMKRVAGLLEAQGCRVRSVEPPSGAPDGWDVADAIAAGDDVEAFIRGAGRVPQLVAREAVVEVVGNAQRVTLREEYAEPEKRDLEMFGFKRGQGGRYVVSLHGICGTLEGHQRWAGRIWFDTFLDDVFSDGFGTVERWTDQHTALLTRWFQAVLELPGTTTAAVHEAVQLVARSNARDCVRDWLESLQWDGVERLNALMPVAFGAPADDYHAAVGRCWLISIAARGMAPGCKVDTMPVFEGGQGIGKSTALRILGGEWFGEMHEEIGSKDFVLAMRGKMLVEIAELHAFRRADVDRLKGIMSTQVDEIRRPYGRTPERMPRRCVFAGTTNRDDWQSDETGARRFWPVRCGRIDLQWLTDCRTQLFAEAVDLWRRGFRHWDIPEGAHAAHVMARRPCDPWEEILDGALVSHRRYTTREILGQVLQIDAADQSQQHARRLAAVMRAIGWDMRTTRSAEDGVTKRWVCLDVS
jgi:hypothetical protein